MIAMNIIRRAGACAAAAALGALVTFVASGCGGMRAIAVTTNGLEKKTGTQVVQDAAAAIEAAKSVHVTGLIFSPRYRFDVRIQAADRAGTETLAGGQAQVIIIGGTHVGYADTYLKAGPQVLKNYFRASVPVQLLAGRWLKVPPALGASLLGYGFSRNDFAAALVTFFSPPEPTVRQATLGGRKVVVVSYRTARSSTSRTPAPPTRFAGTTRAQEQDGRTSPSTAPTSTSPRPATLSTSPRRARSQGRRAVPCPRASSARRSPGYPG